MPIIFVENMICFGGKCSRLTFYDSIKMFVTNWVLFTMAKEIPLELLTIVIAFVCQKYNIYIYICICYGVSICDKHEDIENDKKFWRENFPLTFHICDDIYPSQLNFFFIFLIEFEFAMNMLTIIYS